MLPRRTFLNSLAATCAVGGCYRPPQQPSNAPPTLQGAKFKLVLPKDCPLQEVIELRCNSFRVSHGAEVSIAPSDRIDLADAHVAVVSGPQMALLKPKPLPPAVGDDTGLYLAGLPIVYRQALVSNGSQTAAVVLGSDAVLLWVRRDLFNNETNRSRYKEKFDRDLPVPRTWDEMRDVVGIFADQGATPLGVVEAFGADADGARQFLVHAASYAKGPNWSSFTFDSETGQCRLHEPPFGRGMQEFVALAKQAESITDERTARLSFVQGKAAMLISRQPPTLGIDRADMDPKVVEQIGVASLPGAKEVYNPRTKKFEPASTPNRCSHFASTGWFVVLGHADSPASAMLLKYLIEPAELEYLAPASRKGWRPAHSQLLSQPQQLAGLGLNLTALQQYSAALSSSLIQENWVADDRFPRADEWEKILMDAVRRSLTDPTTIAAALTDASRAADALFANDRKAFLAAYRRSLGLPALVEFDPSAPR